MSQEPVVPNAEARTEAIMELIVRANEKVAEAALAGYANSYFPHYMDRLKKIHTLILLECVGNDACDKCCMKGDGTE